MDNPEELDDVTELAESGAPTDDGLRVWSLDDDPDDLDDEVTSVAGVATELDAPDDLDDEVTAVARVSETTPDDLGDEVTAVMNRSAPRESVEAPVAPTKRLAARPKQSSPERRLSAPAAVATTTAKPGGSLRDRLPEVRDPWEPPSRPRSPEFAAVAPAKRRTAVPIIVAALVATAIIFAAVWWLIPEDTEELPAVDDLVELGVDDAN